MPLFNEASRIFGPDNITLLRRYVSQAADLLEESGSSYSSTYLCSSIVSLYDSIVRDANYIAELGAQLPIYRALFHPTVTKQNNIQRDVPAQLLSE